MERQIREIAGEIKFRKKKKGAKRVHIVQSPFFGKHFKDWMEEKKSDRISISARMHRVVGRST